MADPRYEVFRDKDSKWRWRLRAGNGEIVATGEAHTTKTDALRAIGDTAGITTEAAATEIRVVNDDAA